MYLPKSGRLDLKIDSMLTSILRFYEKFLNNYRSIFILLSQFDKKKKYMHAVVYFWNN